MSEAELIGKIIEKVMDTEMFKEKDRQAAEIQRHAFSIAEYMLGKETYSLKEMTRALIVQVTNQTNHLLRVEKF